MIEDLNINDDVKVLKLKVLKENLKQNWNLDTDIWNEEFPHDYRFEDTYLQLSFILRDFNIDELKHLIYITDLFNIRNYSHDISTLINNYIKSCVEYLNHEIDGNSDEYFKKYDKNNNCFAFEKKIKDALSKHKIEYSLFFYGTLKASEVREAVLGESINNHDITNGNLSHHMVYKVRDANYPLIKCTNNKDDIVHGILIYNISSDELVKLDKFEGVNYFRQYVKVNIAGEFFDSQIYMPHKNMLYSEPWNYENWYKNDMEKFFNNEFNLNGVETINNK